MLLQISCHEQDIECEFIAGCSNQIITINETVFESTLSDLIDGESSIVIEQEISRYMASMFTLYRSWVFTESTYEILADTTLKLILDGTDTIYEVKNSPTILEFLEPIDRDGYWTNEKLFFAVSSQYLKGEYPDQRPVTKVFQGWNNIGRKYFAFRTTSENHTTYGWCEVEVINYRIVIYRYGII